MIEAAPIESTSAPRVHCASCQTEQEAPRGGFVVCAGCGKPLGDTLSNRVEAAAALERSFDETAAEAASALPFEAPKNQHSRWIGEIWAADKRLLTCLSMIPGWGPWRLSRSELHTRHERQNLTAISLVVTL